MDSFAGLQQQLFEQVFQPVMLAFDMAHLLEDGYRGAAWFLLGVLQIGIIATVLVPLQRLKPAEAMLDPHTVRVDMLYTVIHRLGFFRLFMFLTLEPLLDELFGAWRAGALGTLHLDQWWPGVSDLAIVSLVIYLIAFDFVDYWIHRAQHASRHWWALHSLHHAQKQMTCWSDNRNHLLDDALRDIILVAVAFFIGVSPSQFVMIVVFTQLSESLQHANLRLSFGRFGDWLWVSPRFHRLHHSIEHGFGHNFGVLLPWWDMLFGTAKWLAVYAPTGVDDSHKTDYGRGFWAQQLRGVQRLIRA